MDKPSDQETVHRALLSYLGLAVLKKGDDFKADAENAIAALARIEAREKQLLADNAALVESYRRTWGCVQHDNVVHSPECNAKTRGECTPECPARDVSALLKADHPGAALLEENQRLRETTKACADNLQVRPEDLVAGCALVATDLESERKSNERLRADSERLRKALLETSLYEDMEQRPCWCMDAGCLSVSGRQERCARLSALLESTP